MTPMENKMTPSKAREIVLGSQDQYWPSSSPTYLRAVGFLAGIAYREEEINTLRNEVQFLNGKLSDREEEMGRLVKALEEIVEVNMNRSCVDCGGDRHQARKALEHHALWKKENE